MYVDARSRSLDVPFSHAAKVHIIESCVVLGEYCEKSTVVALNLVSSVAAPSPVTIVQGSHWCWLDLVVCTYWL